MIIRRGRSFWLLALLSFSLPGALVACHGSDTPQEAGGGGQAGGGGGQGGDDAGGGAGAGCAAQGQDCSVLRCCSGLICAGGAGCQAPVSDRDLKRDFAPVDGGGVLESLAALPISSWRYRTDAPGTRHIGPTAQDFKATFDVGASERTILQVDADGVALAAIQALRERVVQLEKQNAALAREVAALRGRLPSGGRRPSP
jgi:hypothetical protein